jgi:hypothetical protein
MRQWELSKINRDGMPWVRRDGVRLQEAVFRLSSYFVALALVTFADEFLNCFVHFGPMVETVDAFGGFRPIIVNCRAFGVGQLDD